MKREYSLSEFQVDVAQREAEEARANLKEETEKRTFWKSPEEFESLEREVRDIANSSLDSSPFSFIQY